MSSTLTPHLHSITETCTALTSLPFPPPRKFVNALLHTPDITKLLRDTEAHERALFTAVTDADKTSYVTSGSVNFSSGGNVGIKRNTAMGAYLGGDMERRIRRGTIAGGGVLGGTGVDVELLLKGAERLVGVYPIPNAQSRIGKLREQYESLKDSIEHYSQQVDEQTRELEALHEGVAVEDVKMEDVGEEGEEEITLAMIEEEQRALAELEEKKLRLEMDMAKYQRYLTG
ncbi:DASH complex, subunit Spc34 [Ascobolus immersus RN42]|uniref:DASH complex subunit SPC34 n=1 Tax=Ascobolus immersus RN42 TaxID=1160509 RepID=A0A3N4IEZ3_ASCIM|nr:DASH complex, subunit Spc34 [Ascobolus immersus RN42]